MLNLSCGGSADLFCPALLQGMNIFCFVNIPSIFLDTCASFQRPGKSGVRRIQESNL